MNKLDNILKHLATQEPELIDADALCESIMEQLPQQAQKENYWIGLLRWSTSIAAMFLLALFIGQTLEAETALDSTPKYNYVSNYRQTLNEATNAATIQEALHQVAKNKENRTSIYNIRKKYAL